MHAISNLQINIDRVNYVQHNFTLILFIYTCNKDPYQIEWYLDGVSLYSVQMSQAINCNFARTAIRSISQRKVESGKQLSYTVIAVVADYNQHFEGHDMMQLRLAVALKRIPDLFATFNNKWYPHNQQKTFLSFFH